MTVMTREEAIAILISQIDEDPFWTTEYRRQIHEALRMGIEALKHDLEQETILDRISDEIEELYSYVEFDEDIKTSFNMVRLEEVQRVIDKYKAESE